MKKSENVSEIHQNVSEIHQNVCKIHHNVSKIHQNVSKVHSFYGLSLSISPVARDTFFVQKKHRRLLS